jgi:RNA polymerase sigma factor (sigma-70 family)
MVSAAAERTEVAGGQSVAAVPQEGVGDDELLGRFLSDDESISETAFARLVDRHGPMVLGVCRQILGRVQDAEDAFQATFLVLARGAGSIRDRRALGRWLYEVAYRISVRSKVRAARRGAVEKEAGLMSGNDVRPVSDPAWDELMPALHEEVNRLPEKYRSAVVLCYLEGRTNEEAAALLQWPVGTVKGRLSRARDLLQQRLTRRGLAISALLLLSRLGQETAFAEVVPSSLARETARTAVAVSRRGGARLTEVSPRIRDLVDGDHASRGSFAPPRPWMIVTFGVMAAILAFFFWPAPPADGSGLPPTSSSLFALPARVNVFSAEPAPACHKK